MKKILSLLMVAGLFSLVACGPSEEEKAKAAEDAAAAVEEMMGGLEEAIDESNAEVEEPTEETTELAEHVCSDKCTADACYFKCGEKGHVCTDECHADKTKDEHADGEEDNHNE